MTQQIKAIAAKADDLSLVFRKKERTDPGKLPSDLHMHTVSHAHSYTHT